MFTPRNLRRKAGKYRRPTSQTPGRDKGDNCKCSPDDRFFAKRNRSHKHKGYAEWCRRMDAKMRAKQ